jgi:type I restriction enzyme M protein
MLAVALSTQVDSLWRALLESGASPLEAVEQVTSLIADRELGATGIASPQLLDQALALLDSAPMQDPTIQGQAYEHLLGRLAMAQSGPVITPRHIIRLMIDMVEPTPDDIIIDPSVGTGGFLMAAREYLRDRHPRPWLDAGLRENFDSTTFTGVDSDPSMCAIASMNLRLHGIQHPAIAQRDSLAADGAGPSAGSFSLVLATPPFVGIRDMETTAKELLQVVGTKKPELLFLVRALRLLSDHGRAAIIVPDSVLYGTSKAHITVRRMLVEEHSLDAVVRLPAGVFRPNSGTSTSILLFRKAGVTDSVWFYDVRADGFTLDNERRPIEGDDLPDVVARWRSRSVGPAVPEGSTVPGADAPDPSTATSNRTAQSFLVPRAEIAEQGYDLTFNRYGLVFAERIAHRTPNEILLDVTRLELKIQQAAAALARSLNEPL